MHSPSHSSSHSPSHSPLAAISLSTRRSRRGLYASRRRRPSLAVVFARSLALTLFVALALLSVLARIAHTQASPVSAKPVTTSSTASTAPAKPATEETVGGAMRRAADKHGVWGSLGVGRASAGIDCDACASESSRAYSIQGILGMRLTPRFLIGVESFAWMDVIGGGVDRIARGTYLSARSYAFGQSRLFLQGGLGVASFEVNDGEVGFLTRSPSLSMAAGYDWRVGGVTLTPSITAMASSGGRLNSDRTGNAVSDNARLGLLRTSLSMSWFR